MNDITINNNQKLVFTNAIYLNNAGSGHLNEYELISGRTINNLKLELTLNNISTIEKDYNINLLGLYDTNNYEKVISLNNGILFDSEIFTKRLSDKGLKIQEYVINKIFGNKEFFESAFNSIPLEIEFAGIDTKHFFSRENLSHILKAQPSIINHKFFAYFNIQCVIDDVVMTQYYIFQLSHLQLISPLD